MFRDIKKERSFRLLELNNKLFSAIRFDLPLENTLETILDEIAEEINYVHGAIFLPSEEEVIEAGESKKRKVLEAIASRGYDEETKKLNKYHPGEGLIGYLFDSADMNFLYVPDLETHDWGDKPFRPVYKAEGTYKGIKTAALFSLKVDNTPIGIFEIVAHDLNAFNEAEISSLEIISNSLALAIELARNKHTMIHLYEKNKKLQEEVSNHHINLLGLTYQAVEKESILKDHSAEVADTSRDFAAYLGYNQEFQNKIYLGARIHDVGKLEIAEWFKGKHSRKRYQKPELPEIIKSHAIRGYNLLLEYHIQDSFYQNIVRNHHQRWDGSGYPADGRPLKENEISVEAQIVGLADTYNALISERPYRQKNFLGLGLIWYGPKAFTKEQALQMIEQGLGGHFNPQIGKKFIEFIKTRE